MALKQQLQQKLLQKLSPQQIQLMKLLQIPTASLESRIKEELEENPALELDEPAYNEENSEVAEHAVDRDEENFDEETEDESGSSADDYENVDISEYFHDGDDDVTDYKMQEEKAPEEPESRPLPLRAETGFLDQLNHQLGMLQLDEKELRIAEYVIGSIDEDGYLRRDTESIVDDLAFRQNIITSVNETENIIRKIQQLDPPGIAARNLQECLLIQLSRKIAEAQEETKRKSLLLARKIISEYFEEFSKKHYEKIQRSLNIQEEELKQAIHLISRLNPRPGIHVAAHNKTEHYIVPDFFIVNNGGKPELILNSRNAPELRISESFKEMLRHYEKSGRKDKKQKEAIQFIKQKIDSAKWFIDAIKQRQQTLYKTMEAILQHQYNFFLSGDEADLKPMILKDIAEKTGLDISTVSRVANSKFVQTEFGTYRLKYFFSEAISTDTGEEVSTREVKKILSDLVEQEDKKHPLSDEKLTELLREKGYNIARRTVAKYREQLNIPVARLRKQI
ncbi:MAG: RNA polymerase factor sigma-54 [Chitinophagaceae bacterium]|nr:RNA polymerase factor sigma-54 [Chitinophagaceae bacterium]